MEGFTTVVFRGSEENVQVIPTVKGMKKVKTGRRTGEFKISRISSRVRGRV